MTVRTDAKKLFLDCFGSGGEDADIILGYAAAHGRIELAYKNGEAANMICSTRITDGSFDADYVFAVCTKKEYRRQGLFSSRLESLYGSKPLLLIPENESLIPLYEGLGFTPIYCLEADITGDDTGDEFDGDVQTLYELYKRSFQFPKKDFHLFDASITAHLAYGGTVRCFGNTAMLITDAGVTDVFAPSADEAANAVTHALHGVYSAILPTECAACLDAHSINYRKKCIVMGRNLTHNDIYINTLFN